MDARHKKALKNPYYREGFNAKDRDECPYEMDEKLNYKILGISLIKGDLTENQKQELKRLRRVSGDTVGSVENGILLSQVA